MSRKIVECVPNISEGKDKDKIEAIVEPIRKVDGVKLLSVEPDSDYNRTVITFAGEPDAAVEAMIEMTKKAYELIDMTAHHGEHPRIGAVDVAPFVPIAGVTMEDCVQLSHRFAKRIAEILEIPVYLYEYSAQSPERKNLANIRQGEYEGLSEKLNDPNWVPDYGPAKFVPKFGAMVTGARFFLIAYNVNIPASDKTKAHEIALILREAGKTITNEKGEKIKIPGKYKAVKAIGVYLEKYKISQVSINLVDYRITPPHVIFDAVREEARKLDMNVTGSELIGLIPLEPVVMGGKYALEKNGINSQKASEEEIVRAFHDYLNLSDLYPINIRERIIDYIV